MKNLRDCISEAREKGVAIGHFNISNLEGLHAVFNAAKSMSLPIIIGVSEGERDFVGLHEAVALVRTLREVHDYPIFLNADHTYSFERVKEAVDAGFDAVIFDGAKLSLEENISLTKKCVEYVRASGRNVLVEAELGYIGQSSKVLNSIPEGVELTSVEDAKRFVAETNIDLFAPAVGNIHGMLSNAPEPNLDIGRVRDIAQVVGVPLVLHGASGNSREDIQAAIKAGVAIVHINTEVRVAYRDALKQSLEDHPDEVAPYKINKPDVEAMERVVKDKLVIFNFL